MDGLTMVQRIFATPNDYTFSILRLILGLVFLAHGSQKMLGWFGGAGFTGTMHGFESRGIPTGFPFLAIAAGFFGALGLVLRLLGRIAAFGIMITMLVAICTVLAPNGLF